MQSTLPTSIEALQEALKYWVRYFDRTRLRNKWLATCIRILVIALAGSVTIILAADLSGVFQPTSSQKLKLAAIICSSVGVSLASFEAFVDHKRMWVQCGVALAKATLLQQRLNIVASAEPIDKAEMDVIWQELNLVVGAFSKDWAESRSRSPDVLSQESFGQKNQPPRRRS
jgi:hypothetical protein